MTTDQKVVCASHAGCMAQPELLTRESISIPEIAYALLMRISDFRINSFYLVLN